MLDGRKNGALKILQTNPVLKVNLIGMSNQTVLQ